MKPGIPTDYETYHEIMEDLLNPIQSEGLDFETLKRLYESKLVYLENLRVKCFFEMNLQEASAYFTVEDYRVIMMAIKQTHLNLRKLVLLAVSCSLDIRFANGI